MNQTSHQSFTRGIGRVKSPVSRRRTHRLLRLGLICGAAILAAVGLLLASLAS